VLDVNDDCLAALRTEQIAVGVVPWRTQAPIDREPELREGEQEQ
jgi:hypothetical protein